MPEKKERLSKKAEQLYCFKCGKEISSSHKMEPVGDGKYIGRCLHKSKGGCQRKTYFVTKEGLKGETIDNNPSTTSTASTPSTSSTLPSIDYLILSMLKKERKPFKSIGRGVHNGVFYIGTVLNQGKKELDAIVTSDRHIYVDWGKGEYNQIREDFGLNYRFPLFIDCMDNWWSNKSIEKWYKDGYSVDIKQLYNKIVSLNKKYMIYEDERIHKYTALDIIRTYFFDLFPANNRTYHHADPGSGKTNQLMLYRALSFNPISSTDFSSASIYRIIESTSGTILIDDFDNLPEEQKSSIIQHIRTNYKKFKTIRADGNKKNRPYAYNSYSHLVFNNVYGLGHDLVTPERLITIRLLKHKDAKDITINSDDNFWKPIHDDLYVMALQYWEQVKESYDSIEVEDLNARGLEIIKPILAIAAIISDDIYNDILTWYKETIKQENIRDVTEDWEFLLLKELWERTRYKEDTEEVRVFVKEIAEGIANSVSSPSSEGYKQTLNRLYAFVGGKLKGYLFKGGRSKGVTRYEVYKERVCQVLDSKDLLKTVEESTGEGTGEGVEGVEGVTLKSTKTKDIDFFDKNDLSTEEKSSQYDKIQEIIKNIEDNRKAGYKITDDFLYNHFDHSLIDGLMKSGQLIKQGNGEYVFGGFQ